MRPKPQQPVWKSAVDDLQQFQAITQQEAMMELMMQKMGTPTLVPETQPTPSYEAFEESSIMPLLNLRECELCAAQKLRACDLENNVDAENLAMDSGGVQINFGFV